ncbi:hypothetical protein AHMF7616_01027 [Adhaeribacter pallidiroseus]|uniref:FAR-17a/AIG1-like protein n=2 Tax=Adhaeribacter pallidiroseus TaxID=2072847 RepID=A0A369QC07_9BACT|nr:hypothetical protein AHMF7616_01027 [Adhaeribacter pallidiroseus]
MRKGILTLIFLLEWIALISQFYLNLHSQIASPAETIIRYFSYFTLDTNLIIALLSTCLLLMPNSKIAAFFSKQATQTAVAIYIFIVGLIYNLVLRFIWDPQGLQMLVDELLHVVNPVLFIIYWILFSHQDQLNWKIILYWLIYPFAYLLFVLIRANWTSFYPYPFLNVKTIGIQSVLLNCLGISLLFLVLSAIFLTWGNFIAKKNLLL